MSLSVNPVRLQSYKNVNRIIYTWNNVPLEIREVELTENGRNTTFKKEVKKWLAMECMEKYDVYNPCTWKVKCICNVYKIVYTPRKTPPEYMLFPAHR